MHRNAAEKRAEVIPVMVDAIELKSAPVVLTRHVSADVEAQNQAVVMSRLNAYVADMPLSEGDRFKKGDVLMRLDLSEALSSLGRSRANLAAVRLQRATLAADLASAKSRLGAEEEKYRRTAALYKIGGVSLEALQEMEAEIAAARAAYAASQAAMQGYGTLLAANRAEVTAAEENLRYGIIRAPFEGAVSRRLVQRGDLVTPGKPLLNLVDTRAGQRLLVDMPVDLAPASLIVSGRTYPLKAWPAAGAQGTRRYEAHAEGFIPGSRIAVQVVISSQAAFFLPDKCLLDDDGKSASVLRLKDHAHVESVRIALSGEGDEGAASQDSRLAGA
ncbi:MAG TPA: hypothetical protein PLK99_13715, partial [Burkholderiales bacterium]|nr:hypothetical protein [Burkholderiales bacterium]